MSTPKVLIMGKGTKINGADRIQDLISAVDPENIPLHVLHSVQVTAADGTSYKVDKKYFSAGIRSNNIHEQLSAIGLKHELTQIDIILDLDKTYKILSTAVDSLLADMFNVN